MRSNTTLAKYYNCEFSHFHMAFVFSDPQLASPTGKTRAFKPMGHFLVNVATEVIRVGTMAQGTHNQYIYSFGNAGEISNPVHLIAREERITRQ